MTSGGRMPTWRERENNKRRERRRRAIAAKIFAGLRAHGNYRLPKHCDNNEVLRALCAEAGWTVEPDGTTYRSGCKPPEQTEVVGGGSASPSPCSSYQPSPRASYNLSPASSSFASPASSSYITHANPFINGPEGSSFLPWLKNLSNSSAASAKLPQLPHLYIHNCSISAPVTPPLSSPTARTPRMKTDRDDRTAEPPWAGSNDAFLANSMPPSPGRIQLSSTGPSSPTYSLVSPTHFGLFMGAMTGGSSRICTPGESGTCSPVMAGAPHQADVQMSDGGSDEFAFGSSSNDNNNRATGMVKAWEGEMIHEECGLDELELTLGSSTTRTHAAR